MDDTAVMPPVTGIDPGADTDEDRRRRAANLIALPPPARPQPSANSSPMPAVSPGSATPWITPPPKPAAPAVMPSPSAQVYNSGDLTQPKTSLPPLASMPPVQVGPEEKRYEELSAQGAPQLHGWKKALDVIGSMFKGGQGIEQNIPGTPQNYNAQLNAQAIKAAREQTLGKGKQEAETSAAQAQFNTPENRRAYMQQHPDEFDGVSDFEKNDFILSGKFPQREPAEAKPENIQQEYAAAVADAQKRGVDPAKDPKVQQLQDAITSLQPGQNKAASLDKKIDEFVDPQNNRVNVMQRPDGTTYNAIRGQSRAEAGVSSPTDVRDVAAGIMGGTEPPDMSQYGYRDRTAIQAELKRNGFNFSLANQDWKATQRYLSSLNGPQQVRYRQAVDFTIQSLDQAQRIFDWWQKAGATAGWKTFNKASLAVAKQLPGEAGSAANNLDAAIADLTSELGTVYKGGNSSTDESLKLAAKNLSEDWNQQTFADAMKRIHESIGYRQNSMNHLPPAGVAPNSPYTPPNEKPAAPPKKGDVVDGWKFNGGEPSDKKNWEKVAKPNA